MKNISIALLFWVLSQSPLLAQSTLPPLPKPNTNPIRIKPTVDASMSLLYRYPTEDWIRNRKLWRNVLLTGSCNFEWKDTTIRGCAEDYLKYMNWLINTASITKDNMVWTAITNRVKTEDWVKVLYDINQKMDELLK